MEIEKEEYDNFAHRTLVAWLGTKIAVLIIACFAMALPIFLTGQMTPDGFSSTVSLSSAVDVILLIWAGGITILIEAVSGAIANKGLFGNYRVLPLFAWNWAPRILLEPEKLAEEALQHD